MYQLNNNQEWDTDFFHFLMSDKRIFSSKEAKIIREKLATDGALPHLDNNFDWAMLCIGYCFAKGWAYKPKDLLPAPNSHGTEIPSFTTCFQDYSRLWLVVLSDALFRHYPDKAVTKDDLYRLIADLWHTGAVKLDEFWERCRAFKPEDELAQRQEFLNELAELAIKNAGVGQHTVSGSLKTPLTNAPSNDLSEKIVAILQNMGKGVKEIQLSAQGVRYDEYLVQFAGYPEWDKWHEHFCSALGVKSDKGNVRAEQHSGIPHALDIKILRNKDTWQTLGRNEFQAALTQYSTLKRPFKLPVLLGVDEYGNAVFNDFADAPHAIIGGATGTGKSALLRAMLHSLFKFADEQSTEIAIVYCKDSRDFSEFQNYPNLWQGKIISEPNEALEALAYFVEEMDRRYQSDEPLSSHKTMILVIDELADLVIVNKQVETQLIRLAMKARAAGIHLLLATQRPDAKTLDGQLRDNLPVKIALRVDSRSASEIILKEGGAENLGEKGDHLVRWNGGAAQFLHGYNV